MSCCDCEGWFQLSKHPRLTWPLTLRRLLKRQMSILSFFSFISHHSFMINSWAGSVFYVPHVLQTSTPSGKYVVLTLSLHLSCASVICWWHHRVIAHTCCTHVDSCALTSSLCVCAGAVYQRSVKRCVWDVSSGVLRCWCELWHRWPGPVLARHPRPVSRAEPAGGAPHPEPQHRCVTMTTAITSAHLPARSFTPTVHPQSSRGQRWRSP